jgi:hypothetical protein
MTRLFKVVSPRFPEPTYFGNKEDAKSFRDELEPANLVVMRGPDHWRGESFNVSKQTPKRGARKW